MLIVIMVISTGILVGAVLSGTLLVFQIRQSADITQSTKAFYAADAGLECELFRQRKNTLFACQNNGNIFYDSGDGSWRLTNGARFRLSTSSVAFGPVTLLGARSTGEFGVSGRGSTRALEVVFAEITK